MRSISRMVFASLALFAAASAVAQEQGQNRNWAEERFRMADRNRDGKLGADEVQGFPMLAKALNGGDANSDGFLTLDEAKAYEASQKNGQQSHSTASSTTAVAAASTETEWRVTGFVRQGQRQEASIERPGLRPRFVLEGDRLPGDVIVLEVNYDQRSVTLLDGKETVVVRAENYMAPPPPPPKAIGTQQQWNKSGQQGRWPNPPSKPTAMRDGSGRWHVVMPDGRTTDMQADAQSHGGVRKAIEHVQGRIATVNNPERAEYYKQELEALKRMEAAGMR